MSKQKNIVESKVKLLMGKYGICRLKYEDTIVASVTKIKPAYRFLIYLITANPIKDANNN